MNREDGYASISTVNVDFTIPESYANTFNIGICYFPQMNVDFSYDKNFHKNRR